VVDLLAGTITREMAGNPMWTDLCTLLGPGPTIWERLRLIQREPIHEFRIDIPVSLTFPADTTALRQHFLTHYAHTISDPGTFWFLIRNLVRLGNSRLVSIGAGTGYWEALLAPLLSHVAAFDISPPDILPNEYHTEAQLFHPVHLGGAEKAADFPDHTLFLSWPPPGPLAFDALEAYAGNLLIYMGVPEWTGSGSFFHQLLTRWKLIDFRHPVRWPGVEDTIWVLARK